MILHELLFLSERISLQITIWLVPTQILLTRKAFLDNFLTSPSDCLTSFLIYLFFYRTYYHWIYMLIYFLVYCLSSPYMKFNKGRHHVLLVPCSKPHAYNTVPGYLLNKLRLNFVGQGAAAFQFLENFWKLLCFV